MAASVDDIARLRRIVNEPTTTTYSDAAIAAALERYPVRDVRGMDWLDYDYTTSPPTTKENALWMPTYDIYAAGCEIWQEKAASASCAVQFSADGVSIARNQVYDHCMKNAAWCKSRSCPSSKQFIRKNIYRDDTTGNIVQTDAAITVVENEVENV